MGGRTRKHEVREPCGLGFGQLSRLADELVMAHLQAGHEDALAVLFDRYHRLVFNIALKILRDVGEAEDATQNVFLEIFRVASQFNPERGTTKVWILQYAYHRSMNRRQQLAVRRFYDSADISAVQEYLTADRAAGLTTEETRRLVKQALESLSPVQRNVLQLAYFEGLSLREISEQTGEALGNVRHHYYRGLAKLRTLVLSKGSEAPSLVRKEMADAGT